MQVDLGGLRALVIGSTKGIGLAIAQKLAANGAEVAINARKQADVSQAIDKIRAEVPNAELVSAAGDSATAKGVPAIIEAAGDVDILANMSASLKSRTHSRFPTRTGRGSSKSTCCQAYASRATVRACETKVLAGSFSFHRNPASRYQPK